MFGTKCKITVNLFVSSCFSFWEHLWLIEGDSYISKQRSKQYFVHFRNFVSMLLANEEQNAAFFRLFDDLTINIPSAIQLWTSDGLFVLTLSFKKWKIVEFLLSLKDPSGWIKHGGCESREYWKIIWRSTTYRSAKYGNLPNKSLFSLTLLIFAIWFDLFFLKKAFCCKIWNLLLCYCFFKHMKIILTFFNTLISYIKGTLMQIWKSPHALEII